MMPQWTQDEAIAFECACEAITHMMAIQSELIYEESHRIEPDADRIASARAELSRLHQERSVMLVEDHFEFARIRTEYGSIIGARRMVQQ